MTQTIDLTQRAPRRRRWPVVLAWTAASIVYAVALNQVDVPFLYALPSTTFYYFSLAALMIPVSRWSLKLHARRSATSAIAVRHILVGLGVILFWQALNAGFLRLAIGPDVWEVVYAQSWMFQLMGALSTYGAALGLTLAFQATDRERERERRESELMILARDSELAAIKAQMQPHFVLNVLNSVVALIDKDPALARTMVIRLSDLMRAVFEQFEVVQIPLRREIELTQAYLEIERIRFGPRLSIAMDVAGDAAAAIVPAFLLQPIVENAIKHGIGQHSGPGDLRVCARLLNGRMALTVTNTPGSLAQAENSSHGGRGLQLTRRRLSATFGDDYDLRFESGTNCLTVRLDLPALVHETETAAVVIS